MRRLIRTLLFLLPSLPVIVCAEEYVTDSMMWKLERVDSLNLGDLTCQHEWVYDNLGSNYGCLVLHPPGYICDLSTDHAERICKNCLRREWVVEVYYQHWQKGEFDILRDSLKIDPLWHSIIRDSMMWDSTGEMKR